MQTKVVSSILDVIEPKDLDVSKDLTKNEQSLASIKELFEEKHNEEKEKDKQ